MRLGSQSEMDNRSTSLILSFICLLAPLFWPIHASQMDTIGEESGNNVDDPFGLGKRRGAGDLWSGGKQSGQEEQDDAIMELIKESPWALIPLKAGSSGKRLKFGPRLGREEDMVFTETSRSPPFAPRLGRRMPFSPRLGRALYNSRPSSSQ